MAENAQHEPAWPWSFTGVTLPCERRSYAAGRASCTDIGAERDSLALMWERSRGGGISPDGRTPPSSDEASMVSPAVFWYARKSGLIGATETAMLFCPPVAAAGTASAMPAMRATTTTICFRVTMHIRNLR